MDYKALAAGAAARVLDAYVRDPQSPIDRTIKNEVVEAVTEQIAVAIAPKSPVQSVTIQGIVVAAAGVLLTPKLSELGVTDTMAQEQVVGAAITLGGLAWSAWGRFRAKRPIR